MRSHSTIHFGLPCTRLLMCVLLAFSHQCVNAESPGNVLTQHNDNMRTGHYTAETQLTPKSIQSGRFKRLFELQVVGQVYAQPLYVKGLAFGKNIRNVVFVATQQNMIYAFDADAGGAPLWKTQLKPNRNSGPVSAKDDTVTTAVYPVIFPYFGITSTPVIDLDRGTLYVVSMSVNIAILQKGAGPSPVGSPVQHRLYAINIRNGKVKGSTEILGSVPGTGDGASSARLDFNPRRHINRPGLLLLNNTVYVAFGGNGEKRPYHGWVFGYDADTLLPKGIYATNQDGEGAGIWQSGNGLAADDANNIYFMTGNGGNVFDDSYMGQSDLRGSSFIKLSTAGRSLAEVDYFTPFNQQCLDTCDLDLGSGGPVMLPGLGRMLGGGKEGRLYLLDADHLGDGPVPNDTQIRQCFKATEDQQPGADARRRCEHRTCVYAPSPPEATLGGLTSNYWQTEVKLYPHIHGSPVVWSQDSGSTYRVYLWAERDRLKAFQYYNGAFRDPNGLALNCPQPGNAESVDESNEIAPFDTMPGGILSLSSNNNADGTVILWASIPKGNEGEGERADHPVTGILRAYDAANLKSLLWKDEDFSPHGFVKFLPPTIGGGKVFMGTTLGKVVVFGLVR